MGSAEFEFGALPRAWASLRSAVSSDNFERYSFDHHWGSNDSWHPVKEPRTMHVVAREGLPRFKGSFFDLPKKERVVSDPANLVGWIVVGSIFSGMLITVDQKLADRLVKELSNPVPTNLAVAQATTVAAPLVNANDVQLYDFVTVSNGAFGFVSAITENNAVEIMLPDESFKTYRVNLLTSLKKTTSKDELKGVARQIRRARHSSRQQ
jgi:hypothetical protein